MSLPFDFRWVSIAGVAGLAEGRSMGWLTPAERAQYASFAVAKRRRDWLAGRVAAKETCRVRHGLGGEDSFQAIEIIAITDGPERGRPIYRMGGVTSPYGLSISHSGDMAIAALARTERVRLGIDLEWIEPRSPGFDELALSRSELESLAGVTGAARWRAITRIWAVKEALTKALGCGLRIALPRITVAHRPTGEVDLERDPFRVDQPDDLPRFERARAGAIDLDAAVVAWVLLE